MNTTASDPTEHLIGLKIETNKTFADNLDPISKSFAEFASRYICYDYSIENYSIPCIGAYHSQPRGRAKPTTQHIGGFAYAASVARTSGLLVVRRAEIELKLTNLDVIALEFMSIPPCSQSSAIQRAFDLWLANSNRAHELTGYVRQQLTQQGGFVCMGNSKRSNAKPTKQTRHWLPLITELINSVLNAPEAPVQSGGGRQSKSQNTTEQPIQHDSEMPNE